MNKGFEETISIHAAEISDNAKSLNAISEKLSTVSTKIDSIGKGRGKGEASKPGSPPKVSAEHLKQKIGRLLKKKDFENAFCTALNASNLDVVKWTCGQVGAPQSFSGSHPLPITQTLIICLIHQLGTDFSSPDV